jgi:hypothetical protein
MYEVNNEFELFNVKKITYVPINRSKRPIPVSAPERFLQNRIQPSQNGMNPTGDPDPHRWQEANLYRYIGRQ